MNERRKPARQAILFIFHLFYTHTDSMRDQEEGGELDSHEEVRLLLRVQERSSVGRWCWTLKRSQERSRAGRWSRWVQKDGPLLLQFSSTAVLRTLSL